MPCFNASMRPIIGAGFCAGGRAVVISRAFVYHRQDSQAVLILVLLRFENTIGKLAEERRDRDTVINDVMRDWLFQTPVIGRSELAKLRRPKAELRGRTPA